MVDLERLNVTLLSVFLVVHEEQLQVVQGFGNSSAVRFEYTVREAPQHVVAVDVLVGLLEIFTDSVVLVVPKLLLEGYGQFLYFQDFLLDPPLFAYLADDLNGFLEGRLFILATKLRTNGEVLGCFARV